MNYNELKLSIYESYDNGEIDEIEKNILLERLEEKFNEEDNSTFSNLYEATAQTRNSIKTSAKLHKLNKLVEKYKKSNNIDMIKKIDDEIEKCCQRLSKIDPLLHAQHTNSSGRMAGHTNDYEYINMGKSNAEHNRWRKNY